MTRATIQRLPLEQWPAAYRNAWRENIRRQPWNERYARRIRGGVECWFGFAGGDLLPTPDDVFAYEAALRQRLSERTAIAYIQHLAYGIQIAAPAGDWRWLVRHALDRLPRPVPPERTPAPPRKRRYCLPVADWPASWREGWRDVTGLASASRYLHRQSGPTADWSDSYRKRIERGVGVLAAFVREHDRPPALTDELVHECLDWCADRGVSGQSMGMYAEEIHRAFTLMKPGLDLGWLRDLVDELARAPAIRNKAARIVRVHQLQQKGRDLMRDAGRRPLTTETALQYRDGLILAVWAVRPCRLSNFVALTIGESLVVSDTGASIVIDKTKNGDGYTACWPPVLFKPLQIYLQLYREYLRNDRPDDKRLWLGRDGAALTAGGLSRHFGNLTVREFGHRINPHLLRDCAVTSIVETDPREVLRASALAGHRDPRTTDRHYQHATSYAAAELTYDLLAGYRMPPAPKTRTRK
ncbi:hypothetical protein [Inquilinus sp. CAU 1745]|uniref:hypothetical protein n=1 Tax=Inquilinus sp. CAU 1745 TaxID=3140369 RepID=UPI00325AADEF